MKKYFNYAFASAIVLLGANVFTACSSDEPIVAQSEENAPVSEKYNPATGEVGVEFVMNIATNNEPTTRMSAANTQATTSQTFRGIDNATLMTYVNKDGGNLVDGKNIATAITAAKSYDFGTVLGADALKPSGDGTAAPKSRRVLELALPTETNTLLFWGKAIKTGTNQQQGSVTWPNTMNKDLSQISFTVDRRIPTGSGENGEAAFTQHQNFVATLLTKLVDSRANYNVTYNAVNYSATGFGWKDYVTWDTDHLVAKQTINWGGEDHSLTPLGEIMADAFIKMNTFYAGEVRAGSGPALAMVLGDLYDVIQTVAGANPTSAGEALTKAVAGSLQSLIGQMINTSSKQWVTNLADLKTLSGLPADQTNLVANLNNFPRVTFNVPQGATVLKLAIDNKTDDATRSFTYSYDNEIPSYAMNGDINAKFNPLNYRYPAELCYFGNSPVRVDNASHEVTEYPDGADDWTTDDSWTGTWTKNSHVMSSSRSVAMQQNINYGSALLQTTVRYGAATLYDNNAAIQEARKGTTEADNAINVSSSTFSLTGILIGGVEPEVGWNYIAKAASPKFESFIYDNDLPSTSIPTYASDPAAGKSIPNYTLVWDNWNPAVGKDDKQNVVYIALEFVNNSGKDFWGYHNLIRNGQTFYISGKLDPDKDGALSTSDRSAGITWPTNYALPPYNADGTSVNRRRIFIQDYKTIADFVLGANSLKAALIDVPDLRSSQISLGLSVDLEWQSGLNFENIILGQ